MVLRDAPGEVEDGRLFEAQVRSPRPRRFYICVDLVQLLVEVDRVQEVTLLYLIFNLKKVSLLLWVNKRLTGFFINGSVKVKPFQTDLRAKEEIFLIVSQIEVVDLLLQNVTIFGN